MTETSSSVKKHEWGGEGGLLFYPTDRTSHASKERKHVYVYIIYYKIQRVVQIVVNIFIHAYINE